MRSYAKGYRREREMVYALAELGYMAIRAPRSGRIGLPSPDIVAAKDGRLIVLECKAREAAFTVDQEQLAELKAWEEKAGASAYIAWKLSRKDWKFIRLSDVMANRGNVGKKFAEERGIAIHEI